MADSAPLSPHQKNSLPLRLVGNPFVLPVHVTKNGCARRENEGNNAQIELYRLISKSGVFDEEIVGRNVFFFFFKDKRSWQQRRVSIFLVITNGTKLRPDMNHGITIKVLWLCK